MIRLRILHLATSVADARSGDVLTMMSWLGDHGHTTALAAGGDGELPGVEVIRYRAKAPAWWMGGKHDLLAQATAWNPDLIHLHGICAFPAARALANKLSLPVIASIGELLPPDAARPLREPEVAWVLLPTELHRAHYLGRTRLHRDRVSVLPFAIDMRICAQTPVRPNGAQLVLGTRSHDAEGCERLLDAVALLRRDEVPVRVLMARPEAPELREAAQATIARLQADTWCQMIELTSTQDLIGRCDILVQSDDIDSPMETAIIAMACGRPVIATEVGGIPELVREGQAGLLVPAQDGNALAVAITRLVREPALRQRLASAGQAFASERYDIQVVGPVTLELYHAALIARQSASVKAEGSRAYHRRVTDNNKVG